MKNKKLLERITKIKNSKAREIMIDTYKKLNAQERKEIGNYHEIFEYHLKNDLNFRAKAIAAYIRFYMEDFHVKNFSDKQMKELNQIIRNAIYTFFIDENDGDTMDISVLCKENLKPYWEDCKYIGEH